MHKLERREEMIRLSLTSGLMMGSMILIILLFYTAIVIG